MGSLKSYLNFESVHPVRNYSKKSLHISKQLRPFPPDSKNPKRPQRRLPVFTRQRGYDQSSSIITGRFHEPDDGSIDPRNALDGPFGMHDDLQGQFELDKAARAVADRG